MAIGTFRNAWQAVTTTQAAPTDSSVPDADSSATVSNGARGSQFLMEFDLYGTSGTQNATITLYFWDPARQRWAASPTTISLTSTQTASGPGSRVVYALDSILPYFGVKPVVSAISGTGATVSCAITTNGP